MPSRYDDRDLERYDDRAADDYRQRADYDRTRYDRGESYGRGETYGRPADRYTGGRDYGAEAYGRTDSRRGARRFDYERESTYETDYRAPADRDYSRADYARARDYERNYERDYGRAAERARGSDYYGTRAARDYDYDYNRRERDYAPRGYDYDEERGDWSVRRGTTRPDDARTREARGRNEGRGKERGWWERVSDEVASWFGDEAAERRRLRDEARTGAHFRGRGPRGYRRSDERIREDVNDRLTDHPYLDASDIEVEVHNGEVTLNGAVESRQAKRLAEDIAESISGVTNVENRLRINRGAFETIEPKELPTPATAMTPADATGATPAAGTTATDTTDATDANEMTRVRATGAGATGTGSTKTNT